MSTNKYNSVIGRRQKLSEFLVPFLQHLFFVGWTIRVKRIFTQKPMVGKGLG